jgi:hypothetical protein
MVSIFCKYGKWMLVSKCLLDVISVLYEKKFCRFGSWKPYQSQIKFNVNVRLKLDDMYYILEKFIAVINP